MGRVSFETVCNFDVDWPYEKPVFVWSSVRTEIPESLKGKAFLVNGTIQDILNQIHEKGFYSLYIDGGKTIQSFLKEDLIDSMIITIIPRLLGAGIPLFGELANELAFECTTSKVFADKIVQNHFQRIKE
ncbi:dihydrofolate reductase family protein [Reichenbachiella faecimaris]|uniref:dihydrofolate reductase family protein n=1 Tax=Reichenbachiella faecimaris TaxID=692418 RepID=UPI001FE8E9FD|nr:dihydrofolate reductase family protein [Reichenbachiella faecimaris]